MKKVIIWGAEGGIGKALLKAFQNEGWWAAAAARKLTTRSELADQRAAADFTRPDETRKAVEELVGDQKLDVYVYAAGDISSQKVSQADPERWEEIISSNLNGVFHTLQASLPYLAEDAHIFILGAVSERLTLPGLSAYAAAKAGVEALAVSLSKEERRKKISVIRPGAVATELWEKVPFKQPENSMSPEKLARKVLDAYQEGHKGQLDLV